MEKYISNNSFYLVGSFQDVLEELRNLALEHTTVQDILDCYLN
ncbi:MAG: hypothetical protein ACOYJ1_16640 [Peptococcales bacterium]